MVNEFEEAAVAYAKSLYNVKASAAERDEAGNRFARAVFDYYGDSPFAIALHRIAAFARMGAESGERGMGNGERGMGNGERGMGNGERGMGNGEREELGEPEADASGTEQGSGAKAKRKLGRICHRTAMDFVIAWYEPGREDGADARKVQAWATRNVSGLWDITARLDCETVATAIFYRNSATYALRVCRALVAAIQVQANHARRNRRNRAKRNDLPPQVCAAPSGGAPDRQRGHSIAVTAGRDPRLMKLGVEELGEPEADASETEPGSGATNG